MADETPRDEEQEGVMPEAGDGTAADDVAPGVASGAPEPVESADPADVAPAPDEQPAAEAGAEAPAEDAQGTDDSGAEAPRARPAIPGADLEVDLVLEGSDAPRTEYDEDGEEIVADEAPEEDLTTTPIAAASIDLAADARYRATGKRKTAVARVILRPGTGVYTINGKVLDDFFPRVTLQRNIRQPLEAVGYEERMDVVARMHGGGVSSQAGALRHGISRALLEADPNLRGELKRRGFLTRDARAKERKKAGLKKARKRPQFSKR
jgi:small subunit ribosomal protein S9